MKLAHAILQKLGNKLPLQLIDHDGRPYLRRYYIGTLFGIRFYLHHFVDNDPDGLHNHPQRHSLSIMLSNIYQEERRWCRIPLQRTVRFFNYIGGDALHRVLLFRDGAGNPLTVWTLFVHTKKVMSWATIKDKGLYQQYYEHTPNFELKDGHSTRWLTAKKGAELLNPDGSVRVQSI